MVYPEYKKASERHLETCLQLVGIVDNKDQYKLSSLDIERLLSNMYYLTGYIIECILNYAIFKYIRFPPVADINTLYSTSEGKTYDISFRSKKGVGFFITQPQHKLGGYSNFFIINGVPGADQVPFLDGRDIGSHYPTAAKTLFDEWQAEIRYHIDSSKIILTQTNVYEFLCLASDIYDGVRKHITHD